MASSPAGVRSRNVRNQFASLEQAGVFLKNFLKHPLMLGSAIPSSRYLISRVLDQVDWTSTRTAVEYGPGVGTFTRPILDRMSAVAKLLAIELNAEFAQMLRSEIPDPRLYVAHGSCSEVGRWMKTHSLSQAEFILSGIPYTVLPNEVRRQILTGTRDSLSPDGVFLVYQYTRAVLPDLKEVFSSVEEDFEPLNILPARIFVCRK